MEQSRAEVIVNQCQSALERIRMARVSQVMGSDSKHGSLYRVFGLPAELTFEHKKNMYDRNGVAGGAIDKLAGKTWESYPELVEGEPSAENKVDSLLEKELRKFCKRTKLWRAFRAMDTKRMVGNYAALIIKIADGQGWSRPATNVRPDQIAGYMPVWECQLRVSDTDMDRTSERYGEPKSWAYQEIVSYDNTLNSKPVQEVSIHWTRVVYFGDVFTDGPTSEFGNNLLARGFNAFTAIEKINQSGAEGFFKNAARQLQANFTKDANLDEMARSMGIKPNEIKDAFNAIGRDLNSMFDAFMVTKEVDVNALSVSMPSPQEFFDCCLQEACASLGGFPATELTGHMTGDRSSSENNKVMAQLATSRRVNVLNNDIEDFFTHLSEIGCFKGVEVSPAWDDLLDASTGEKLANAKLMAEINQMGLGLGERYYTPQEIRTESGMEPEPEDGLEELPPPEQQPEDGIQQQ